jgi:hypothetical protein
MATVESWTRNGDYQVVEECDPDKIRELEEAPFDDSSDISWTRVTGDG